MAENEENSFSDNLSDFVYKWLNTALDLGIPEKDFWDMTLAEVNRAANSKLRMIKMEDEKRASFDYILADLIGRSVSRVYNSSNKMPTLSEAYPTLFNKEEENERIQQKKDELSALRFKQFANSYNNKYKEVAKS